MNEKPSTSTAHTNEVMIDGHKRHNKSRWFGMIRRNSPPGNSLRPEQFWWCLGLEGTYQVDSTTDTTIPVLSDRQTASGVSIELVTRKHHGKQ